VLAALCVAGLPTDRFAFEGFLPSREQAARGRLQRLAHEDRTLVFYESPRRAGRTLGVMVDVFGAERPACAARELTKLHETQYRGTLAEVAKAVAADPYGDAGEFVLLVGPAPESAAETGEIRRVLDLLSSQVSRRTAIDLASSILNRPRNEVYAQALTEEPPA
jgi:16S rRNA (cytidine1402-2'-O)-methyltransferase